MTRGQPSVSVLVIIACALLSWANAGEYVLQDLVAMETAARSTHRAPIHAASDKRKESMNGRPHKSPRQVAGVKNATEEDDEDKKTLAQQVADGKYGLIQTELFVQPPERPGIISYEVNPEVPKDNVNNLGGLKPEEIWLAENHLLVLAGGGRYDDSLRDGPSWPPIDAYRAPPRQVKIPPEPKVPPPFPVRLRPGGPTEFIRGANGTGGPPPFAFFPPPPGNFTGGPPGPFFGPPFDPFQGNFTPGNGPPFPFPPFPSNGSALPPKFAPGPFPPPGADFLPPPVNLTGQLDEDDPSIYYPPPYDFVYERDNTTAVPPGPLVPGIVLPPPPDFFAPLEDERRNKKRPTATPKPKKRPMPVRPAVKRPAVKIVTDDPSQQPDLNEVTPTTVAHALPADAVVQGWVPVPAPRPFYITGIAKPHINTGYDYRRPIDEPKKWIDYDRSRPIYDQSVYARPTTTTTTPSPIKAKTVKAIYLYDEPRQQPESPLRYFYLTRAPPTAAAETTTVRPPVFEYSYTAPGYGTIEAPRLSVVSTTPPPPIHLSDDSYDYQSNYRYERPRPDYSRTSTLRPVTDASRAQSPYIVQTENPYHAYFTRHDYSLIDDITKKYFTVFGQKLNGDSPTTPLVTRLQDTTDRPALTTPRPSIYTPIYWSTPAPSPTPTATPTPLQDVRYQEYDYYYGGRGSDYEYPTAIRDYYDDGNVRQNEAISLLSQRHPNYVSDTRLNALSPTPYPTKKPDAQRFGPLHSDRYLYGGYKSQATQAQSLRHDTRVNYVQPQRPKNPDAEEFDPASFSGYTVRPPIRTGDIDLGDPETRQRLLSDLYERLLGGRTGATPLRHRPPSLADDLRVNHAFARVNVSASPDVEVFAPDPQAGVVAYRLPGNGGGHFYFLTPQTAAHEEPHRTPYRRRNVRDRHETRDTGSHGNRRTLVRR